MRIARAAYVSASSFSALLALFTIFPGSVAHADAPRTAIVVVGDPAAATVEAAERLDGALSATSDVTLPADPAMRAALRGAPAPEADDGLGPVRALRRQLGWSDEADLEALATIGRQLELVAIVLVRGGEIPTARVFDVRAGRRFNGEAALDAESLEGAVRFVTVRARTAAERPVPTPAEAAGTTAAGETPTAAGTTAAAGATTAAPAAVGADTDERPRRRWIARNWPYLVAGGLVVGAAGFFIAQRDTSSSGSPVIHVRPGGSP